MKWSRVISRHSLAVLLVALALLPPAILGASRVRVNWDLFTYLPRQVASVVAFDILDREFHDASVGFLIVEGKTTVGLAALKADIAQVPGVVDVLGGDDVAAPAIPREILPDELRKSFYSEKGSLLVVRFAEGPAADSTRKAVAGIKSLLDDDCYLTGTAVLSVEVNGLVESGMVLTLALAVACVALVLGLTMGSFLIPLVFLVEIGFAVAFNMGSNLVLGQVSFITQSLASVLQLGVTMDFSIFLLHRYEEERLLHADRRDAMAAAIDKTFSNVLGSALTDVAGFMALCAMQLGFGFDIGIVMSKGVLLGLLVSLTVLPSLLLLLDRPIRRLAHRPIMIGFRGMARFSTRKPLLILAVAVLLLPLAWWGSRKVPVDYDLMGNPPKDLPAVVASGKLKTDFHLLTTHFVITRDDLSPTVSRDFIDRLEAVEGVTSVIALEKYLGGLIPKEFVPEGIGSIFRQGGRSLSIVTSDLKVGSPAEMEQVEAIEAVVRTFDPEGFITGEGALSKDLIRIADSDFRRVDTISVMAIAVIILILFRSLSIPVILVGAIELAIMANMAVPYYFGGEVSFVSTIVIGCIQLGCTIDYSILLVSRFREELVLARAGLPATPASGRGAGKAARREARLKDRAVARHAMVEALSKAAPSILTSGLILSGATASAALVSSLGMLTSICILISRGAAVSVLVVFFVLPSLVLAAEPLIGKTTLRWRGSAAPREDEPGGAESHEA